jgi:hypothetical protein
MRPTYGQPIRELSISVLKIHRNNDESPGDARAFVCFVRSEILAKMNWKFAFLATGA